MGFSAYLQSVIANYEKQRDRYTLTDLQVEYREEKGRSPEGSERQTEKKVERLEVLTLVEVLKAVYEKSLIAKAIITYIDKLSEEPNHGA